VPAALSRRAALTPNNGMHPTSDTPAFIISRDAGGRVMPSVRRLVRRI
jgi:hypothetical protein